MAFKQPRVPEFHEKEGVAKHLKSLTLFLKDFCQDVWVASKQAHKGIAAIPALSDVMLTLYPVGSIYMNVNNVRPADLFGGEWEQMKDCFLLAAGDAYAAGSTGGTASHTHGLTQAHAAISLGYDGEAFYIMGDYAEKAFVPTFYAGTMPSAGELSEQVEIPFSPKLLGSTDATSNLPPYMAVYVWRRLK